MRKISCGRRPRQSCTEDPYGHGTHIGAIIAGSSPYPQDSTWQTPFRGVAPGANLISLRVIGADGTGKASDVIEAIHWAIKNRKRFNIRVINLSLGGPVEQSYNDDPMCEAVERAVHAGIVVVAAAGNRGKDDEGRSVYGLIESPGIDPYVITVGASNTKGTARRSDDELATYSSKGPTVIDGLIKPDLVAPGNKIVSAEALGASLIADHPTLHAAGAGADAYMTLNGTSMSAGVVSGAVALVLEANTKLTPAQVKMALQYSATFMPEVGLVGAGAGSLNAAAAIGVALNGPIRADHARLMGRAGSVVRRGDITAAHPARQPDSRAIRFLGRRSSGVTSSSGATDHLGRPDHLGGPDHLGRHHRLGQHHRLG